MRAPTSRDHLEARRRVVRQLLDGPSPAGTDFDACRAVLAADLDDHSTFQAICMLLEGALADPRTPVDDVQVIVPLLKDLARREVSPQELL